jgi:hypothetical protein
MRALCVYSSTQLLDTPRIREMQQRDGDWCQAEGLCMIRRKKDKGANKHYATLEIHGSLLV